MVTERPHVPGTVPSVRRVQPQARPGGNQRATMPYATVWDSDATRVIKKEYVWSEGICLGMWGRPRCVKTGVYRSPFMHLFIHSFSLLGPWKPGPGRSHAQGQVSPQARGSMNHVPWFQEGVNNRLWDEVRALEEDKPPRPNLKTGVGSERGIRVACGLFGEKSEHVQSLDGLVAYGGGVSHHNVLD